MTKTFGDKEALLVAVKANPTLYIAECWEMLKDIQEKIKIEDC